MVYICFCILQKHTKVQYNDWGVWSHRLSNNAAKAIEIMVLVAYRNLPQEQGKKCVEMRPGMISNQR
jgi:hypothetical protein